MINLFTHNKFIFIFLDVPKEKCTNVPKQECKNVPTQKCKSISMKDVGSHILILFMSS